MENTFEEVDSYPPVRSFLVARDGLALDQLQPGSSEREPSSFEEHLALLWIENPARTKQWGIFVLVCSTTE